jgi:hypothetical protein
LAHRLSDTLIAPNHDTFSDAFLQGMREFGYSDGKNLVIEWRHAEGDYKRLADLTTELLRMDPLSSPPRSISSAPGLSQV